MIHVNTEGGRIGPLWWLNSDTTPAPSERLFDGAIQGHRFIRWGTCGWGRTVRMTFEEVA